MYLHLYIQDNGKFFFSSVTTNNACIYLTLGKKFANKRRTKIYLGIHLFPLSPSFFVSEYIPIYTYTARYEATVIG